MATVKHREVSTLAERLEFANALIKQYRRDLSALSVEHGKSAAYITELEERIEADAKRIVDLESAVASLKSVVKKSPEDRLQTKLDTCRKELDRCRRSRDTLMQQLNFPKR